MHKYIDQFQLRLVSVAHWISNAEKLRNFFLEFQQIFKLLCKISLGTYLNQSCLKTSSSWKSVRECLLDIMVANHSLCVNHGGIGMKSITFNN